MDREAYKKEIKFKLTGGLLDLELDDEALNALIDSSLREIQGYINATKIITIPFKDCIDLSEYNVNTVSGVFRTQGYTASSPESSANADPVQASFWQLASGGAGLGNFSNFTLNMASLGTLQQIENTLSTDLSYYFDESTQKLYINAYSGALQNVTIEYVPRYNDVSEINSDYWIDLLMRLCIANAKIVVGRIRSRFTQSNALWTQDGATMLEEGNREYDAIKAFLSDNTMLSYPID